MGVVYVAERRLVSPRLTSTLVGRNRQVWYRDLQTERLVLDVGWLLTAARPLGGLQSPKNGQAVLLLSGAAPAGGRFVLHVRTRTATWAFRARSARRAARRTSWGLLALGKVPGSVIPQRPQLC